MTVFRRALRSTVGDITIEAHLEEGSGENWAPAAFLMAVDPHFPFSREKLADNLVAVLNGHEPLHKFEAGKNRILWSCWENALMVHLQRNGQGVSHPALILSTSSKSSAASLGQAALGQLNEDAMKKFCAAVKQDSPTASPSSPQRHPPTGM